jgi:hypothetical protein
VGHSSRGKMVDWGSSIAVWYFGASAKAVVFGTVRVSVNMLL